jgi:hypothetical protein
MDQANAAKPVQEFIFRGNATASGGYLKVLDGKPVVLKPDMITVHGECSLPGIGGIAQSLVERPVLRFEPWIRYGQCETHVEGVGDNGSKLTTLRASVEQASVTTRPSPQDNVPHVREISFSAERLSLQVRSLHPMEKQPTFFLLSPPVAEGLSLRITPLQGPIKAMSFELEFGHPLFSGYTMDEFDHDFTTKRKFFDEFAPRLQTKNGVKFGEKPPRSEHGYVFTSIVKAYRLDGKSYAGNEHFEPGFGKITFGQMIVDGYSRRVSLVKVKTGSDPEGFAEYAAVDTNGIWR